MLASIIIPSINIKRDMSGLESDIACQKVFFDTEVIKTTGVSPAAKARNMGAKKAKGQILIFLDCDMRLGNEFVLANLIKPLLEDESIGAVSPSFLMPKDASRFQVCYIREVPHCEVSIVEEVIDIALASTQCYAIYRDIFFKLSGFNEKIIRGEDSEFSVRLKKAGYRIVMAPNTWCYHPWPNNLPQLIKIHFRNGAGVCFVDTFHPELNVDIHPKGILGSSEQKDTVQRTSRFLFGIGRAILEMKILLLLAKFFYLVGYSYGIIKYKIFRKG